MPLPIKIHVPAKMTAPLRILAGHVINILYRARIDRDPTRSASTGVEGRDDTGARRGRFGAEGTAARLGEGIAERGEDEEEEEEECGEEGESGDVEQSPWSGWAPARRWQIDVAHGWSGWGLDRGHERETERSFLFEG